MIVEFCFVYGLLLLYIGRILISFAILRVKVEKLIKELPSVPADWSNGDVKSTDKSSGMSNGLTLHHAENGSNLRDTQSMLLERIASEMNRLKFYIAHAQVSVSDALPSISPC